MSASLTDTQLIELVQQKPADELTESEILQLRTRLRESSELQTVLIEQLHLEAYLHRALGEHRVSVEEIVQRAQSLQQGRWKRWASAWPVWMGLAVVLLAGLVGWRAWLNEQPAEVFARNENGPPNGDDEQPDETLPDDTGDSGKPLGAGAGTGENVAAEPVDANAKRPGTNTDPSAAGNPNQVAGRPGTGSRPDKPATPEPAKIPESAPWFAGIGPDAEPLDFVTFAAAEPAWLQRETLDRRQLQKWFTPVSGFGLNIEEKDYERIRCSRLNGMAKLRAPWPRDAALRLALFGADRLRIHLYSGESGVTLQFMNQVYPHVWSGFVTTRKPGKPQPETMVLAASDHGRHLRSRLGPLTLRWQNGQLLVMRGSQQLMTLPLAKPPEDVYFEGSTWLSEIALQQTTAVPLPVETLAFHSVGPDVANQWDWQAKRPDDQNREILQDLSVGRTVWEETLGKKTIAAAQENGRVQLRGEDSDRPAWIMTPLPTAGVGDLVFHLPEITAGTGFFLTNERGDELVSYAFHRDRRSGQLVLRRASRNGGNELIDVDPLNQWVTFVGTDCWLRISMGLSDAKIWTGVDGVNWARATHGPLRGFERRPTHFGLFVWRGDSARSISVEHLENRELGTLASLIPAPLRPLLPVEKLLAAGDLSDWHGVVLSTCPPEESIASWRRACAVVTLTRGRWNEAARAILRGLIDDVIADKSRSPEERFRFLHETALIYDLWEADPARAMAKMYERLGDQLVLEGRLDAAGEVIWRLQQSPMWTSWGNPLFTPEYFDRQARAVISVDRWDLAWNWVEAARTWATSAQPSYDGGGGHRENLALSQWLTMSARANDPQRFADEPHFRRLRAGAATAHPVVTQWSKEAYNVMAEFEAALRGEAWEDACRIISATGRAGMLGLLPDARDERLLVSLPRAVDLAMRDHPELLSTMQSRFGPVGRIRVREAILRGDVDAVEATTVRFFGTAAAAEAYRWLGDRALANGRFLEALAAYQSVADAQPNSTDAAAVARKRLAGALLGEEVGTAVATPVALGETTLTAEQFETLTRELRQQNAQSRLSRLSQQPGFSSGGAHVVPEPGTMEIAWRKSLGGDWGQGGGRYEYRLTDAVGRQIATAVDEQHVYLSNRFQIVAINRNDGNVRWRAGLGGEQGNAHDWPFERMQPVLAGKQLFCRRLTKRGIELMSVQTADGKRLWQTRPEGTLLSDPVLAGELLLVVMGKSSQAGYIDYHLTGFRPDSGEIVADRLLVRMRDEWRGRPPCSLTRTGNRLLCTLGGATLCCDFSGQPDWLRQQPWLPESVATDRATAFRQPAFVTDDSAFVFPPDSVSVSRLDLTTGRQRWVTVVPHLLRMVGISRAHVVVQTRFGLIGLRRETGEVEWEQLIPELLHASLCGEDQLLVTRKLAISKEDAVGFIWIDPATGTEIAHSVLPEIRDDGVKFGPFIPTDDGLCVCVGSGHKAIHRDLLMLRSTQQAPAGPLKSSPITIWLENITEYSIANTALQLPGWTLLTPHDLPGSNKGARLITDFRDADSVLMTRVYVERPVRFYRQVSVPKTGKTTLELQVGHADGELWDCAILAGEKTLWQSRIDQSSSGGQGWVKQTIDLTPWAGQTLLLQAVHTRPLDEKASGPGYWKTLKLVHQPPVQNAPPHPTKD